MIKLNYIAGWSRCTKADDFRNQAVLIVVIILLITTPFVSAKVYKRLKPHFPKNIVVSSLLGAMYVLLTIATVLVTPIIGLMIVSWCT